MHIRFETFCDQYSSLVGGPAHAEKPSKCSTPSISPVPWNIGGYGRFKMNRGLIVTQIART